MNFKQYKLTGIISFVFVFAALFSGCEIDEGIDGSVSADTYYRGENGINNGITGIYGTYRNHFASSHLVKDYLTIYTGGDDLTTSLGTNKWYYAQADIFERTSANTYVTNHYQFGYRAIGACNLLIDKADKGSVSPEFYNHAIGNARFVRALVYFNLTRTFGNIVMPLSPDIEETGGMVTQEVVLNQIIEDLKFASENVINEARDNSSSVKGSVVDGHASKTAAKAFMAKAYMALAGYPSNATTDKNGNNCWEMVEKYTQEIIDEGVYSMLDDYAHNFGWVGEAQTGGTEVQEWEGNMEAIWSLNAQKEYSGQMQNEIRWGSAPFAEWTDYFMEWSFYQKYFDKKDYRAKFTATDDRSWDYLGYTKFDVATKNGNPAITKFHWGGVSYTLFLKYRGERGAAPAVPPSEWRGYEAQYELSNDVPVLRYSEVLLMNAEANERLGNVGEAIEKLNWVRRRAYAGGLPCQIDTIGNAIEAGNVTTPSGYLMTEGYWMNDEPAVDYPQPTDTDDMVDGNILRTAIINERATEFVGELTGARWFDMVRLKIVGEATDLRADREYNKIDDKSAPHDVTNWYFPVPSIEMDFCPELEFNIPGTGPNE